MKDCMYIRGIKTMVLNIQKLFLSSGTISNARKHSETSDPTIGINHSLLISRWLLISLTSLLYLTGPPKSPLGIKILVVMPMLAAVFLSQNLYHSKEIGDILASLYNPTQIMLQDPPESGDKGKPKPRLLIILIAIETIGTALLTLPTGGLDSPFAWYALNPIIAAAFYLPFYCPWITMVVFLDTALLSRLLTMGTVASFPSDLSNHMNLIILLCLLTALAQVASALYKKLARAYSQLEIAHQNSEKALAHIASLYQALEACSSGEDQAQITHILADYAAILCQRPAACFICESGVWENDAHISIAGEENPFDHPEWDKEMMKLWAEVEQGMSKLTYRPLGQDYQLAAQPLIAHSECYGILAFLDCRQQTAQTDDKVKSLAFLAGLGGITLERLKADKLYSRLLVSEEQNRIANEIHDGVAQYLFSMVCAVHTLAKQPLSVQDSIVQQQLRLLEDTAGKASRELRASIYGLSPRQRGESLFVESIAAYLDNLGRLNGIQVDLQVQGSEEVISPALRQALYRIVREASSNALRHGKCTSLQVYLGMDPGKTRLEIKDNGRGWKVKGISPRQKAGLGLRNMQQTAELFGGELQIDNYHGKGTTIRCIIPKPAIEPKEEHYEIGTYR